MTTKKEYRDWIRRLHSIAEEYHKKNIRPNDQCALRWSANIVADKLNNKKNLMKRIIQWING